MPGTVHPSKAQPALLISPVSIRFAPYPATKFPLQVTCLYIAMAFCICEANWIEAGRNRNVAAIIGSGGP